MWLIRIWHIVTEPVEKAASWMDGTAEEPPWRKPSTHHCYGCGKERPTAVFEAVDTWVGGKFSLLVRCDDCRTPRTLSSPFDSREKKT